MPNQSIETMKTIISIAFITMMSIHITAQTLRPYVLVGTSPDDITAVEPAIIQSLTDAGFEVLGSYEPDVEPRRVVIAFSSNDLKSAVRSTGGLTGFAAALRLSLTESDNGVEIAYTTPEYWCNAYFRNDFHIVQNDVQTVSTALRSALKEFGDTPVEYGSEKGLSVSKLQKYHYMMAMPYFDDTEVLGSYSSYKEAINQLDNIFASGAPGTKLVYTTELEDEELKLYGVALTGEDGESHFMPIVDISSPNHTAFLPYEILVVGNEVHMLHGKFRIALSFPDLSMGTFMKISSTPKDIRNTFTRALSSE